MLRVFLLGQIPAEEARAYVAAFAEHAETDLARYEHQRDSVPWSDDPADAPGDFFGRAALEYGLRNAAMEAKWARWLIDRDGPPPDIVGNIWLHHDSFRYIVNVSEAQIVLPVDKKDTDHEHPIHTPRRPLRGPAGPGFGFGAGRTP